MTMIKADLHLHSTASDGSKTPTQVVEWAKETGLNVIAVTDHDSVSGVDEAKAAGEKLGIKVLTGIEISTFSNQEIHILGYNFDYKNPEFLQELEKVKNSRKLRNAVIKQKLMDRGIDLDMDVTADGVGRLHLAKRLIEMGLAKDINDAFERYLGPTGCVYTEVKRTAPVEAVKLIKRFGGISSIAHPKKYLLDKKLELLIGGLAEFGLGGIETYYPSHNDYDKKDLMSIANKYNLILTGGSDFHGDEDKHFQVDLPERTAKALNIKL